VPAWVAVQYALLGGSRRSLSADHPEAHITEALDKWLKFLEAQTKTSPNRGK